MKLIFTADTHFGSKFNNENAALRDAELVSAFDSIACYAESINAAAVLLGGDLFDTPNPGQETSAAVRRVFERHCSLRFLAVCGNHDPFGITEFYSSPPENLYIFPDKIKGVDLGGITVFGISLSSAFNMPDPWKDFRGACDEENKDGFITLTHGTLGGQGGFSLNLQSLAATGAKLSLLGHIHKTNEAVLPNGKHALYAGVPFGRGFDECGQKGFYVIDTQDFSYTYVNTEAKIYTEYNFDISGAHSVSNILNILSKKTPAENEIARAVLTGRLGTPFNIDCDALCAHTDGFVQIKDRTSADIDYLSSMGDNTLEGRFVKILADRLKDADELGRQIIEDAIKEGVIAIRGGEEK